MPLAESGLSLCNGACLTVTHYLTDHGVDPGPLVLQEAAPIRPDDTAEALHQRIKESSTSPWR
jgi:folate-dependent phosphoribosylglycinamide formyltransferase PurN